MTFLSCCSSWYLILPIIGYIGYKYFQKVQMQKKLERWNNTPKDVVILHGIPRSPTIPSASPFILKLETYLRMAKIKYEYDSTDSFGPKGKTPWISLNGEHVGDSQLIINFLEKKFEKNLNGSYSEDQLAVATLARVALEEHFFWAAALWTFVFDKAHHIYNHITHINPKWLIGVFVGRKVKKVGWYHGIGRHSQEEIQALASKDIRSVAKILGNKKFLLGDEPCADDAALFGFFAQTQWGLLMGSPYQKLVNDELKNVQEYCVRMKEKFWPDWEANCAH
jgi:glutathione S-transferase